MNRALFLSVIVCAFFTGCATSAPRAKMEKPFPADFAVEKFTRLNPSVSFEEKDVTDAAAVERIRLEIIKAVRKIEGQPFTDAAVINAAPDTLSLKVVITRHDSGNAFARAMVAGLGQIHIDGIITVREGVSAEPVAKYVVKKTFAWGGMYGGFTKIEDVEAGFAEGVVQPIKELIQKKPARNK